MSGSRKFVISFNDERSRWTITADALDRLRTALPADWELVVVADRVSSRGDGSGVAEAARSAIRDAEVFAGFGFPRDLMLAARQLAWVHTGSAGVASLLYPELIASDIILTNSAGIYAAPMAETVIAMALYFARGLDYAVQSQKRASWDQSAFESDESQVYELAGRTMGVLGYGGIGREVARRAHALGMRVIATRRTRSGRDEFAEFTIGDEGGTDRVLRESDVVVIALPATLQTRLLLGPDQLARMKPGAVLINVSRGTVVNEAALTAALARGSIRGAGLDVFEHEPLPAESPLWRMPNALVTPHVSGTSPRYWEREVELIIDNFGRYLRNMPLRNVVNKTAGY